MGGPADATPIALAVVETNGHYLIGPRPPGTPLEGLWEFPGGKVQQHETPADAAARECREETGLDVEVLDCLAVELHGYPHGWVRLHFFRCRPQGAHGTPRRPFLWVRKEELSAYSFPAGNQQVVRCLLNAANTSG
jgi:8-oxo-dGTP diphosphatase